MNKYEPILNFLINWLDKPLAKIGMSKMEFFSLLMLASVWFPNVIRPEWADWIEQYLVPAVQSYAGLGLALAANDRLKALKTVNLKAEDPTTKLW